MVRGYHPISSYICTGDVVNFSSGLFGFLWHNRLFQYANIILGGIVPSHNRFNQCNCSLVRAVGMWTCRNESTCSRIFLTVSSCCNCSRTGLLDSLSVSISVMVTFTGYRAGSGFKVLLILQEKIVRSNQSFPCRLHGNSSSRWYTSACRTVSLSARPTHRLMNVNGTKPMRWWGGDGVHTYAVQHLYSASGVVGGVFRKKVCQTALSGCVSDESSSTYPRVFSLPYRGYI